MKTIIEKNPALVIRQLLSHKFSSLEEASKILDLGSRQSLSNLLKRFSEGSGSFRSFTNILNKLDYEVEYSVQPSKHSKFPYEQFQKYIYQKQIRKASLLLNTQIKNQIITEEEYVEFSNILEKNKSFKEGSFKTIVTLSEQSIQTITSFNQKLDFSTNTNLLINKKLISDQLYKKLENALSKNDIPENHFLLKELEQSIELEVVDELKTFDIEEYLLNFEKVWVKTQDETIHDVSKFFSPKALNELKLKKNQKNLNIKNIVFWGLDIYSISVKYKNKPYTSTFTKDDGIENIIIF